MKYTTDKKAWDAEWKQSHNIDDSSSFIGKWLRDQRLTHVKNILNSLDSEMSIIDMGCGAGTTLTILRSLGFDKAIGIDYSSEAIKRCEALGFVEGKDVFNIDAVDTKYPDKKFDVVFEEGLWEHFEDPSPFVKEAARITGKWMLIIQPNHFTPLGALLHWAWKVFKGGGIFEYSFHINYFIELLDKHGFSMVDRRRDCFWAQDVILFKRRED